MDAEDNRVSVKNGFLELSDSDVRVFQESKIPVECVEGMFYLESLSIVFERASGFHHGLIWMKVSENDMTFLI